MKESGRLIGLVELYERGLDEYNGLLMTKDLGFLLDKNYWHRGLMTEALQLIINFAFENCTKIKFGPGLLFLMKTHKDY